MINDREKGIHTDMSSRNWASRVCSIDLEDGNLVSIHTDGLRGVLRARHVYVEAADVSRRDLVYCGDKKAVRVLGAQKCRGYGLSALEVSERSDHHEDRLLAVDCAAALIKVGVGRRRPETRHL